MKDFKIPELRKFPYPYRAALSICSDIDGTNTCSKYKKIQKFMHNKTGLNFTNSFFPCHDGGDFSFSSGKNEDKKIIIEDIKKGWIDSIHSFGEKKDFSRMDAFKVLNELEYNNCKLECWIDHAQSKSNLCKFRFFGKGDIKGKIEYHFDLTKKFGIKFIWTERLTNIIGQGVPLTLNSLWEIYDIRYPMYSLINIVKTIAKIILDVFGYKKYNYFKENKLINIVTMEDGQKIYEFIRFNNYYKKDPEKGDSFEELSYLISKKVLNHLKKIGGYSIIYVHLGKNFHLNSIDGRKTVIALRNLKQEFERGNIYVDSTSKILNYYINTKFLNWSFEAKNGQYYIYIKTVDDPVFGAYVPKPEQLENITFYVPEKVKLFIKNREINNIRRNPPDHTGRESVTIF